jgi:cellobiose-specific phosphotransferase system component IIC
MKNIKEFIQTELAKLDRGIVATPNSFEDLQSFAQANNGSMDVLLMHMAMQFGMKLALQYVVDEIEVGEAVTKG